jgi:hypothetical protein
MNVCTKPEPGLVVRLIASSFGLAGGGMLVGFSSQGFETIGFYAHSSETAQAVVWKQHVKLLLNKGFVAQERCAHTQDVNLYSG